MSRELVTLSSLPARRGLVCALLCIGASLSSAAPVAFKLPFGTAIEARLLTPVSSYRARPGMSIEAAAVTPVCSAGGDALLAGAIFRGTVAKVHRVGLGLVHETAGLELKFGEMLLPDGRTYSIRSQLVSIDNAREHVDKHGAIHGIRATATLSNRAGQHLVLLAMGHPAAVLPLLAIESMMFHFPEPEIELTRGADLRLTVELPHEWGAVSRCALPEEISERDWTELHSLVDSLPYWSYSQRQPQPMDLVNLLYIGSEDEILRAFAAAGWMEARPNSMHAGLKAIRAIAENRALADAPMRLLLLDGAAPDLQLQKSLDTFEKRDHLRVWARDLEFGGRPVWASAATRDLAATFSIRPFGFTHQIEDDVDIERDQVVSDLAYTGCVDSVAYVSRPETVRTSGESYRRSIVTDSRVAVVTLNACQKPAEDLSSLGKMTRPPKLVRWVRRLTLTARNHFLRDNIVWRTGEAIHFAVRTAQGWRMEERNERRAQALDAQMAARPELRRDVATNRR